MPTSPGGPPTTPFPPLSPEPPSHGARLALEKRLAQALDSNEFDLAGLAAFPGPEEVICLYRDQWLANVRAWAWNKDDGWPSTRNHFAVLMFTLMWVARQHYAVEGGNRLWPHMDEEAAEAARCLEDDPLPPLTASEQAWLGRAFIRGLSLFHYKEAPLRSNAHVDNIVYHCGVPRGSIPGLVEVVLSAVDELQDDAVDLDPEEVANLVPCHFPKLHVRLRAMLQSRRRAAALVWRSIATIARAWRDPHVDAEVELGFLPRAIDRELVRDALIAHRTTVGSSLRDTIRKQAATPPRIRYDFGTGEVRLCLFNGGRHEWDIQAEGQKVIWDNTNRGSSVHFSKPLGRYVSATHRPTNRAFPFTPRLSGFPGLWFNANTGFLEDGGKVEHDGLDPGRWVLLIEGARPRGGTQMQLTRTARSPCLVSIGSSTARPNGRLGRS